MFFLYAVPGAWMPLLSLRCEEELHFGPLQTACAFASWAIGCLVASLIAGQIADRWLSLERCLALGSIIVGTLLFAQAEATTPLWVCVFAVGQCLFMAPMVTLGATLCLAHLDDPEQFGRVRLWGTVGWVLPGLLLGLWLREPGWLVPLLHWLGRNGNTVADSQRLAGLLAFALGIYSWTLPHTPPLRRAGSWLAPLESVYLLRQRPFAVFCVCSLLLNISVPFSTQQAALLLRHLGLDREWVGPALTIAQWSEVAVLWLLPLISLRLGTRATLLTGLVVWAAGQCLLALGNPLWLMAASLAANGFMIGCFWVRGQVFIAHEAGAEIRSSAQGLVAMLNGAGLLLGHFLVGWVRQLAGSDFTVPFAVSATLALATALLFAAGFLLAEEATAAPAEARWLVRSRRTLVTEAVEQEQTA
jgi:predicted MFS family arabinose efflux permease